MMTQTQLEARLLAVETALQEIQRRLATLPPAPNWLDEIIGSLKDEPAFEEVIALGRAFREAQPYPDEPGAPVGRICWIPTTSRFCSGKPGRPMPCWPRSCAPVRATLMAQRVRLRRTDLRIAAIALVRGLVVTRNTRDFGQVPGLQIEDRTVEGRRPCPSP
jgi:hypothetical protein